MAVGLARVKFLGLLLGPFGVGLFGTFEAIITTAAYIFRIGVSGSGFGVVALEKASGDRLRIARAIDALRRLSWSLGLVETFAVGALAWSVSRLIFTDSRQRLAIPILSRVMLLTSMYYVSNLPDTN
jgi:PST family polysaccharide transporter